ncbi:MAG: methyltransferase domain-containing protein [Gammaproteobacteria bacterium]
MSESRRAEFEQDWCSNAGRMMLDEYAARGEPGTQGLLAKVLAAVRPPSVMYRYNPDLRQSPTDVMFANERGQLMLNVGGGPHRESEFEFTLNLRPFANVDLVGDAAAIPFADDTFDAVYSLAVLEHVSDPVRVVSEMRRVLKPGGWLYSEVPFIFFYHGYPADYTRYTLQGMQQLFGELDDAEFGMTYGPVSAALQCVNMLFPLLMPARLGVARKLLTGLYRWTMFPMKYLDIPLKNHPQAHMLAGGFYVFGRKPLRT